LTRPRGVAPLVAAAFLSLFLLLFLGGVGCELIVDLDPLENQQCKADEKACPNERRCANLDDPLSGCADPDTCAPCVLSHAYARCERGVCAVSGCVGDYRHCGGALPGCETDVAHDPENCGACGHRCVTANGYPGCASKTCATGGCFEGYNDCDGNPANGCETVGECPVTF
jgi:hypothetical protein